MAAPVIKIKRSSVPGKIPTTASLPLGELALNTNDGKVYIQQDSVGIGSTVIVVNPWSVGLGSNTYNTFFTVGSVGIGTTVPTSSLHVVGNTLVTGIVTATTFVGALTGTATSTTNIPNLTGAITSVNTTTSLGSFSSANLATALTDETGSGSAVFATSPTLVTPVLGAATATSIVVSSGSTFTNGPILVGTATSTGTASQRLQVDGGAYVSGSVGIGTTNPQAKLHITGQFQSTQANSTTTGGGQIYLNGATGNRIDFNTNGVAAPTFTTRSAGTKLVLYPSVGGSTVDYAFGIEDATLWSSVANSTNQFKWYAGTTNIATLFGTGELVVGTTTKTGTASQPLQVTGGAYVSGNLGVGTTNPSDKLHTLSGNIRVDSATGAVNFWSGAGYYGGIGVAGGLGGSGTDIVIRADTTRSIVFFTGGINDRGRIDSNGIFLVGTATSTGTASQLLQVTGGAYVSGNLGIGTTNPTSKLHVIGDVRVSGVVTATTFVGALTGTATSTNNIPNLTGAITSVNTTTSLGSFTSAQLATALTDETGSGANVFATSPTLVTPVLGAATATSIVVSSGSTFTNGPILVGTATSTGTASQPLQVTGGAYVSGSVGIGTTNPTSKLHVVGDVRVSGIVTASAFSGDGSALTGITASGVVSVQISESAPGSPSVGDLWYNSSVGRIFIYYADDNSDQWVDAAPFNNGGGDGSVVISPLAPEGSVDGSLWFSTISARLFIYYDDGDSAQWIDAAPFNSSSASVFDFPTGDYEDLSTSTIDAFNQNIGDISYDCLSYPLASLVEYDLGTI